MGSEVQDQRNSAATHATARRLRAELEQAAGEARAEGEQRRAAELAHAANVVAALTGALADKLTPRRDREGDRMQPRPDGGVRIGPDDRPPTYTAAELGALLWDAFAVGFCRLAEWNARPRPAKRERG